MLHEVLLTNESKSTSIEVKDNKYTVEILTGIKGADGNNGKDGISFIPSVSDKGILSWTNNSGLPNPDPVNLKYLKDVSSITDAELDFIFNNY